MNLYQFLILALIYLFAIVISGIICKRLRISPVLGYIIAGVIIGPSFLNITNDAEAVMNFSEFGVIVMLFLIGLELNPASLWQMRTNILGLGTLQFISTMAVFSLIFYFGLHSSLLSAIILGAIFSKSSMALVMQILNESKTAKTKKGNAAFCILIFQDVAVIPLFIIIPIIGMKLLPAGSQIHVENTSLISHLNGWIQTIIMISAIVGIPPFVKYCVKPLFKRISRINNREILSAFIFLLVIGTTLIMDSIGLSPALGAFIAGIVLSDSEYKHEVEVTLAPIKGILMGIFFISVGGIINFAIIKGYPKTIILDTLILLCVKTLITSFIAKFNTFNRLSKGESIKLGFLLSQTGEFAFVLLALCNTFQILPKLTYETYTIVVILSMITTPIFMMIINKLSQINSKKAPRPTDNIQSDDDVEVIIAGYGRMGQIIGRILTANDVKMSILDLNSDNIDTLQALGRKVYYGDAGRIDLLQSAGADVAKVMIIAVDNSEHSLEIVSLVRERFPHLKIVARAYSRQHLLDLRQMGLEFHEIERETMAAALNMAGQTLKNLGVRSRTVELQKDSFIKYDHKNIDHFLKIWQEEVKDPHILFINNHVDNILKEILNSDKMKEIFKENHFTVNDLVDKNLTEPAYDFYKKKNP